MGVAHASCLHCVCLRVQDMESSGLAGPNPLMRRTNSGRRTAAGAAAAIEDAEAAVRRCVPVSLKLSATFAQMTSAAAPGWAGIDVIIWL